MDYYPFNYSRQQPKIFNSSTPPIFVIEHGLTLTSGDEFKEFFSKTETFDGDTPLTFAIANCIDNKNLLTSLIKKFDTKPGDYGYLLNIPNDYGETPLHMAAIYNYPDLIKTLMESKYIDPTIKDHRNLTAIDISIIMGHQKVTDIFKNYRNIPISDIKTNIYQWGQIFTSKLSFEINGNQTPLLFNDALSSPIQTSYGQNFSLTLTDTGHVYSAGLCSYGKTGQNKKRDILIPTMIVSLSEKRIKAIACGKDHSLLLDDIGCVYSFGNSSMGRLGLDYSDLGTPPAFISTPTLISSFGDKSMTTIACGIDTSFSISDTGHVYSWGSNVNSKLGYRDLGALCQRTPRKIDNLVKMKQVACSNFHTVLLDEKGYVYTFGSNIEGRLGRSINERETFQAGIVDLDGNRVTKIACGSNFTTVLTQSGQLYSWGSNQRGQLGIPNIARVSDSYEKPQLVKKLISYSIHNFACGKQHVVALTDQGEVYCYGDNSLFQCGIGEVIDLDFNLTRIKAQGVFKVSAGGDNSMISISTEHHSFGEQLYSTLKSGIFSDVRITANGEFSNYITAHKVILAARCKKIDTLLRLQLQDPTKPQSLQLSMTKSIKSVILDDTLYIDFPVTSIKILSNLLKYIYSDHINLTSEFTEELGEVSFGLDIPRLAYLCNFKETRSLANIPKSSLLLDFEILKEESFISIYSDVIFNCISTDEASCGKVLSFKLLAYLGSSYFKTMLSGSFIEKDKKEIQLFETSNSGLKALLNYCYCEEVPEDINDCIDMIIVCDQHQMLRAKDLCAAKIRSQIDNDSLCYIYHVSILYSVKPLKLWCSSKFSTITNVEELYYFDQLPVEIKNEIKEISNTKKIGLFDLLNKYVVNNNSNNSNINNNNNNSSINNTTQNNNNNNKRGFFSFFR